MEAHRMERAARRAWIEWMGGARTEGSRWQWFVTLTFGRDVSEAVAIRAVKRWAREIAVRALGGGHFGLAYVMDRQPDSGRWHFHVLCSFGAVDVDPGWATYVWGAINEWFPTGHAEAARFDGSSRVLQYMFGHHGERGYGLVCSRVRECKHRDCVHGTSPWPKAR